MELQPSGVHTAAAVNDGTLLLYGYTNERYYCDTVDLTTLRSIRSAEEFIVTDALIVNDSLFRICQTEGGMALFQDEVLLEPLVDGYFLMHESGILFTSGSGMGYYDLSGGAYHSIGNYADISIANGILQKGYSGEDPAFYNIATGQRIEPPDYKLSDVCTVEGGYCLWDYDLWGHGEAICRVYLNGNEYALDMSGTGAGPTVDANETGIAFLGTGSLCVVDWETETIRSYLHYEL